MMSGGPTGDDLGADGIPPQCRGQRRDEQETSENPEEED